VNAAPDDANLVYYGDVAPLAKWRLLGPMTAMNGVLMFGWFDRPDVRSVAQDDGERRTAFAPARPDEL
jgi:hypothetical protein